MFPAHRYSFFFRLTCKVLKFAFFFAVGLEFVYMLSVSFGAMVLAWAIGAIVQQWIVQVLVLLLAWMFVAVSIEGLR